MKARLDTSSPRLLLQLLTSNWPDLLLCGGLGLLLLLPTLRLPLAVLIGLLVIRELVQLAVSVKRYVTSLENWMEMVMIGLVITILVNDAEDQQLLNRHLAAVALVLSWTELITLIGRHPKLLSCNVYVTMFYRVLNSFFFFLLWYSLFIIAFGLGFYIMLHDDSIKNDHGLEEEDKNKYFNRTWLSLVKTSAMFVGELEFSDLPINATTNLGMLAYAFFLAFIFLIVVVLMNLLNGLAVSDTNDIKDKAEIYSYISRVETISYMESVLLGDPFDFLSNVPTYLARLPSGSILRRLYRIACCRKVTPAHPAIPILHIPQVISKMGAKGFLLFYTYLPDKQVVRSVRTVCYSFPR